MIKKKPLLVIAGNYSQFREKFGKCSNCKYIPRNMIEEMYGFRECNITFIGTYYERPDLERIEIEILLQKLNRI